MLEAEEPQGSQQVRERWLLYLTNGTLAGSTVLALLTRDLLPDRPVAVILALSVAAAAWMFWWVTLHPQWHVRRGLMVVFLAGQIVLSAGLVWCSPFFGVFSWTGYLFVGYALPPGRLRIFGAVPVAAVSAVSHIGGFQNIGSATGIFVYLAILGCNVLIALVMLSVENRTELIAIRRTQMIDELAETNTKLQAALRENAGLHAQLVSQAREAGVLDERQRMAGEIHDVLAQGLTGIVTQLEAAEAHPGERERHLAAAKRLARESLTEARRSVQALRPQHLDAARLPEALDEVVRGWADLHGVRAELVITGAARRLLPEIEATLLRTAQEALANVAKHAAACRVGLTLSYMEDVVRLDVRDDGAGFDRAEPQQTTADGGFGLRAMRERLSRIAGTLEVESEPGSGTAVSACVPAIVIGSAA